MCVCVCVCVLCVCHVHFTLAATRGRGGVDTRWIVGKWKFSLSILPLTTDALFLLNSLSYAEISNTISDRQESPSPK